jgi:hypothetical protein
MHNLLILYNPYYQNDVVEAHIDMLLSSSCQVSARTAFGKVRSKLRNYEHPFSDMLVSIYNSATQENHIQLFLTDYSSLYVAKVIEVRSDQRCEYSPSYYRSKNLEVENWFIISDMRRIIDRDFELVRDRFLAHCTTPNYGDHHYAVYGNSYVYPLALDLDEQLDYFETDNPDFRYFVEMYKNEKYLTLKQTLIIHKFGGDIFYAFHPNTQDALVMAEAEYLENKDDPFYDFTSVVIHLSKAFEKEVYLFMRKVFAFLTSKEEILKSIGYTVQGLDYTLTQYQLYKPNMGTTKYLIGSAGMIKAVKDHIRDPFLRYFILATIPNIIGEIQPVRNESIHGEAASLQVCAELRRKIVGIGESGVLCDFISKGRVVNGLGDQSNI